MIYETLTSITAFGRSCYLSLSWGRSIQSMPFPIQFLKIHFNTILPSVPRPFQVVSFPKVSWPKPCIHLSYPAHLILDLIFLVVNGEEYRSQSSLLCGHLQSPVTLSVKAQTSSSAPCSQTPPSYIPPSLWETEYHTCTKEWTKL